MNARVLAVPGLFPLCNRIVIQNGVSVGIILCQNGFFKRLYSILSILVYYAKFFCELFLFSPIISSKHTKPQRRMR